MRQAAWRWGRFATPALVLALLVWRLGTGPFVSGVRAIDGRALAAAAAIALLTTVCCAWRWRIVARGLGVTLSMPTAVAAYYRSVFLNVTLPGGVVGDVHRGVSHGRDVGDVNRALRAVVWERSAGQVVQGFLTVAVLLALPSPVRSAMPVVAATVGVALVGAILAARVRPARGRGAGPSPPATRRRPTRSPAAHLRAPGPWSRRCAGSGEASRADGGPRDRPAARRTR
jgi:glycosyltransferase 2 family protein